MSTFKTYYFWGSLQQQQQQQQSHPEFLHPNLSQITLRKWGAKEFALMEKQLGIIIQQW